MTTAEALEFRTFNRAALRRQQSDELSRLREAAEDGDPNAVFVNMDQGKSVLLDGSQPKVMFTIGLDGCYATGVDGVMPSGIRQVLLTHYSPFVDRLTCNG